VGVAIWSKPYRLNRVVQFFPGIPAVLEQAGLGESLSFARSTSAPRDTSYQATQAKIAVGSGGLLGVGVMNGRQKLLYLPEPHNDFIYAIVGEELGLLGTAGLLFCFLLILWRGYRLFLMAPDDFGRYLALGITTSLVFQAFLNMTVVLGMAPTKGLPLPFISYGGSSLLSSLACVGILLSISERVGWGEMTDE
jgi:cell division protein FtsW